jgi:Sigma-70 region 2
MMKKRAPLNGQRDQEEFSFAFSENFRDVCRFVARRSASGDVEAIVSEAFLIAWRNWSKRPSASDEVRPWLFGIARNATRSVDRGKAAEASSALGSGRATMLVASTLDGASNNGTVELGWSGSDESYVFNYPESSGSFETRVVGGDVVQRISDNPWKSIRNDASQLPESGGLAGVAGGFGMLSKKLTFESLGNDGELRRFEATGGLGALDSSDGGFVFGSNGAPGARTTSLEVWIDPEGLIAKVRTTFEGAADGHVIEADAITVLRDLGQPVLIEDPLPG